MEMPGVLPCYRVQGGSYRVAAPVTNLADNDVDVFLFLAYHTDLSQVASSWDDAS